MKPLEKIVRNLILTSIGSKLDSLQFAYRALKMFISLFCEVFLNRFCCMPSCKYLKSKGYIYGPPIDGNGKVLQSSCKKNVCLCMRGDKDRSRMTLTFFFFFFWFCSIILSCKRVEVLSTNCSWIVRDSQLDHYLQSIRPIHHVCDNSTTKWVEAWCTLLVLDLDRHKSILLIVLLLCK